MLEDLINEHGSSSILRERLLLLKDEMGKIIRERAECEKKLADLVEELAETRKQLQQKTIPDEFVEYSGALFKRESSGGYAPTAFCPECKRPLWNTDPEIFPYECSTPGCGYSIEIHEKLTSIVEKLNNKNL